MNTATILVVDDEPQLRRAMKATLTDLGYVVMEAKTGEEALEVLRRDPADLILLDLNMPGIGGLETCRAIRETSELPIIVLSVRNTERDKVEALDAGADDYVTKPFGIQELLARIRAAMRRMPDSRGNGEPLVRGRGTGDRLRNPPCDSQRKEHSSDTEGVRSPEVSGRSSQPADSASKASPDGLGSGLWRRSRISEGRGQSITEENRTHSFRSKISSDGAVGGISLCNSRGKPLSVKPFTLEV